MVRLARSNGCRGTVWPVSTARSMWQSRGTLTALALRRRFWSLAAALVSPRRSWPTVSPAGIRRRQPWSTLGAGLNGSVSALAVLDGKLYAGGSFTTAGGVNAKGIACWDPATSTWSPLGSGVRTWNSLPGVVSALASLNGKLYVGGEFNWAGPTLAKNVACWDPATSTWSALGAGVNKPVSASAVLGGKLYPGGSFTMAGTISAGGVACWDPATSTWSALGPGAGGGEVYDVTVLESKLYVGGKTMYVNGVSVNCIACWDSATSTWSSLGTGIGYYDEHTAVHSLTTLDGKVYAGDVNSTRLMVSLCRTLPAGIRPHRPGRPSDRAWITPFVRWAFSTAGCTREAISLPPVKSLRTGLAVGTRAHRRGPL